MQVNFYVPEEKRILIKKIDELAKFKGRSKSELFLEAIANYIAENEKVELKPVDLGKVLSAKRSDIYEERIEKL